MSLISDLNIILLPSRDYRCLAWILTGWAIAGLYYAHLPWILALGLSLGMSWGLWQITCCSMPQSGLQSIAFQRNKWILSFRDKTEEYDQIRIGADSGFFMLAQFSNSQQHTSRWLVIFFDQLSKTALRSLNILERVGCQSK